MFKSKSGREINYYGSQFGNEIKSNKDVKNLNDLFRILLNSWCKETAYPSAQNDPEYNFDNDPTYGQCAITATIVNDIYGGTIHKIKVAGSGTHYFNKINGKYIDLTRDQFDLYDIPLDYEPNILVDRDYCNKNENTNKRYNLLMEKIKNNLLK